jgi:8-oxo-dGTP diphosphatase
MSERTSGRAVGAAPEDGHVTTVVPGLEAFPRPSLAVDPALLTVEGDRLWAVVWRRRHPPQEGWWALPGVFVNEGEELEAAVHRALRDKAHTSHVSHLEQLFTWNKHGRDPRGWVVTVAYFALLPYDRVQAAVSASDDAALLRVSVHDGEGGTPGALLAEDGTPVSLAFDHDEIIRLVVRRLRERLWQSSVALTLLPDRFTLREMQRVYEAILGHGLNKDSFRRRVMRTQRIVTPTGTLQAGVDHRPAELFTRADVLRTEPPH